MNGMPEVNEVRYPAAVHDLHPAAVRFIEELSLFAEADGLPRIAGRIAGLLLIRQRPVSFDEIAEQLHVSRASVSTNTRLLESLGVIRRLSKLGERKDLFEVGGDFVQRMEELHMQRQRAIQRMASEARRNLPASYAETKAALKRIEEMNTLVIESIEKTLATWAKRNR